MCDLIERNRSGSGPDTPSLAAVRTAEAPELLIDERDAEQLRRWRERAAAIAAQPNKSNNQGNPVIRSNALQIARDDAETVPTARCVNARIRRAKRRPIPRLHLDPLQATKGVRVPDRIPERVKIVRGGPRFRPGAPLRQRATPLLSYLG